MTISRIFIIVFIVYLWFLLYNKIVMKPKLEPYIEKENIIYEPIHFKEKGKWIEGEIIK